MKFPPLLVTPLLILLPLAAAHAQADGLQEAIDRCLQPAQDESVSLLTLAEPCERAFDAAVQDAKRLAATNRLRADSRWSEAGTAASIVAVVRLALNDDALSAGACEAVLEGLKADAKIGSDYLRLFPDPGIKKNLEPLHDECKAAGYLTGKEDWSKVGYLVDFTKGLSGTKRPAAGPSKIDFINSTARWLCVTGGETESGVVTADAQIRIAPNNSASIEVETRGVVGGRVYRQRTRSPGKAVTGKGDKLDLFFSDFVRVSADRLPDGLHWSDASALFLWLNVKPTPPHRADTGPFHLSGYQTEKGHEDVYVCYAAK